MTVLELMKRYGLPSTYATSPARSDAVGTSEACIHVTQRAAIADSLACLPAQGRSGANRSVSSRETARTRSAMSSPVAVANAIPCPVKPAFT